MSVTTYDQQRLVNHFQQYFTELYKNQAVPIHNKNEQLKTENEQLLKSLHEAYEVIFGILESDMKTETNREREIRNNACRRFIEHLDRNRSPSTIEYSIRLNKIQSSNANSSFRRYN